MAIAEHIPANAPYPGNEHHPAHEPTDDDFAAHVSTSSRRAADGLGHQRQCSGNGGTIAA
jgi:hypothetical protein